MFSVQEHQVIATDYKQIPYHPKHLPVFFCDINHRLMDSCPIISSRSLHTWFPIHHSLLFGGRVGISRSWASTRFFVFGSPLELSVPVGVAFSFPDMLRSVIWPSVSASSIHKAIPSWAGRRDGLPPDSVPCMVPQWDSEKCPLCFS